MGKNLNISPWRQRGLHNFLPQRKGEEPAVPQLAENVVTLQTFELKQLMAAISKEMDDRHVTHKGLSKPDASGYQPHDVSSILHSLIKEWDP